MIVLFQRSIVVLFSLLMAASVLTAQSIEWRQTSGPEGGGISILEESPTGVLFAVSDVGAALYRSTDDGYHWQQLELSPGDLTSRPDLIFFSRMGTMFIHQEGSGLLRSTNNGATWRSILPHLNRRVSMTYGPDSGLLAASTLDGLYRSTDDGLTWNPVDSVPTREITAMVVGPDSDIIAGIGLGPYSFGQPTALKRSTDNGITWNRLYTDTTSPRGLFPITSIIYARDVILAGTDGSGILRSTDNGMTWAVCDTAATREYVAPLRVLDDGTIVAGFRDKGIARSTDRGATWMMNPDVPDNISSIVARSGGWMLVGNSSTGIHHSTDNPSVWLTSNSGINRNLFVALSSTSNALFAATSTGGIFRSTTQGETWDELAGLFTRFTTMASAPDGSIYVAAKNRTGTFRILRSTDNGINWTEMPMNHYIEWIYNLASHSSGKLFAGTSQGLLVSTDNCITWIRDTSGPQLQVKDLVINGDYIAAIGFEDVIYRSKIGTNNWDSSRISFPDSMVALNPSVAVTSDGNLFVGTTNGVWRSMNGGASWEKSGKWGEGQAVRSVFVTPKGWIIACRNGGGVSISTDGGDMWNDQSNGLDNRFIVGFTVDSSGSLYAGINFDGVFRAEVSSGALGSRTLPLSVTLYPVHPNPFGGRTTIDFELVHDEDIRLVVVDVMGREVRRLVDGHTAAGRHSVTFDAGSLSAALYFCRLHTASGTLTNPIILKR